MTSNPPLTRERRSCAELETLHDYFHAIDVLRASGLQWTVFLNGIFLDYFAWPHLRSHLKPNVFAIDVAHRAAAIPGAGDVPVTFTYTFDVARYVVAALDLAAWPEESCVAGDTLTWNEFLALAEEARGELHFPKREFLPLTRADTDACVCVRLDRRQVRRCL